MRTIAGIKYMGTAMSCLYKSLHAHSSLPTAFDSVALNLFELWQYLNLFLTLSLASRELLTLVPLLR